MHACFKPKFTKCVHTPNEPHEVLLAFGRPALVTSSHTDLFTMNSIPLLFSGHERIYMLVELKLESRSLHVRASPLRQRITSVRHHTEHDADVNNDIAPITSTSTNPCTIVCRRRYWHDLKQRVLVSTHSSVSVCRHCLTSALCGTTIEMSI